MTVTLTPGAVTLDQLRRIADQPTPVQLDRSLRPAIEASAARVRAVAMGSEAVYGINTGFGKLASVRIGAGDTAQRALGGHRAIGGSATGRYRPDHPGPGLRWSIR